MCYIRNILQICILGLVLVSCSSDNPALERCNDDVVIGAHYYLWFPENFKQGYLRNKLVPKQIPVLGEYDSELAETAARHIQYAKEYGIDFFSLDWWPFREEQNKAVDTFLSAKNISDIQFCIFYESWELNFMPEVGATYFDKAAVDNFVDHLTTIADMYFQHPSYLHIDNRPVIILYLTRTWAGDYAIAMRKLREKMKEKGFNPYIIGDEIFWGIIPQGTRLEDLPAASSSPQVERAKLFDALTAYNLYNQTREDFRGYGRDSSFLEESLRLYKEYKLHPQIRRPVFPTVLPGYNDRGVRLAEDHFPIPRTWDDKSEEGSYFSKSIDTLIKPLMKKGPKVFFITSFNEWNEDTAIEPLVEGPSTMKDSSSTGDQYTNGYSYKGFGTTYLEIIKNKKKEL